jgi:L-ribulose-5-phosphate 3-epimerase
MAILSRRQMLGAFAAIASGAPFSRAANSRLKVGVTDWNLNLGAKPDAIALAAKLGFDGVQVSFGRRLVAGKLPLDDPALIAQYLRLADEHRIPLDGTCVDKLHDNGLKSDPLAPRWVSDSIRLTRELRANVLLLPFFGKWALETDEDMTRTGDALRELAPEAEKAGVILGLEDTISAENNVRIMERARSANVLVYYDVGNSTRAGFDVVKEIRWLGKNRICQFHLKDNPHYLGEGSIPFDAIAQAIRDIGFAGFANLETDAHRETGVEPDMRRNLAFIRGVLAKAG